MVWLQETHYVLAHQFSICSNSHMLVLGKWNNSFENTWKSSFFFFKILWERSAIQLWRVTMKRPSDSLPTGAAGAGDSFSSSHVSESGWTPPHPAKKKQTDLVQMIINSWAITNAPTWVECRYNQNLFEVPENSCSKTREFIFCYRICYIRERGMQKIK